MLTKSRKKPSIQRLKDQKVPDTHRKGKDRKTNDDATGSVDNVESPHSDKREAGTKSAHSTKSPNEQKKTISRKRPSKEKEVKAADDDPTVEEKPNKKTRKGSPIPKVNTKR